MPDTDAERDMAGLLNIKELDHLAAYAFYLERYVPAERWKGRNIRWNPDLPGLRLRRVGRRQE